MSDPLRSYFLLDPDVVFLNHGSFGACPKPVFDVYQDWQRRLERQPVEFLGRKVDGYLNDARTVIGQYLHANPEELIFVPNATMGLNIVIRSLRLQPGDEILTTNHEYGALDKTLDFVARKTGACIVRHPITLPVGSPKDFVESFWAAVTPRTRVVFISHITSPTALIFPIEEICRRAREAGIFSMIDGAHVPGQLPIDLDALGADCYSGNFHKWLCSPKGSAFLHVRKAHHAWIEPMTISWGWDDASSFVVQNQWQGTRDVSAFLSVPAAIDFQREHNWDAVRSECHGLANETRLRMAELAGTPLLAETDAWFGQLVATFLPACDPLVVKERLYDDYRVEVPVFLWNDRVILRVSFQGYNTREDANALIEGVRAILGL